LLKQRFQTPTSLPITPIQAPHSQLSHPDAHLLMSPSVNDAYKGGDLLTGRIEEILCGGGATQQIEKGYDLNGTVDQTSDRCSY
jgi:hypothetical protein